jgi:hypothetical protein
MFHVKPNLTQRVGPGWGTVEGIALCPQTIADSELNAITAQSQRNQRRNHTATALDFYGCGALAVGFRRRCHRADLSASKLVQARRIAYTFAPILIYPPPAPTR